MAEILSPRAGSRWSPSCVCTAVGLGRGPTASVIPGPPKGQLQCLLTGSGVGGCGEEGFRPWPGASAESQGAVTPRLQGIL